MTPWGAGVTAGMLVGYPLGAASYISWGWKGVALGALAAAAGGITGAIARRRWLG